MAYAAVVAAWFVVAQQAPELWRQWRLLVTRALTEVSQPNPAVNALLDQAASVWMLLIAPLLTIVVVTLLAWAAQGAVGIRSRTSRAQLSLHDVTWLRTAWRVVKVLVVLMAVASVANASLRAIVSTATADLGYALRSLSAIASLGASRFGIALALLVIADLLVARLLWRRSLRMTRDELQRELRETHGDPTLRAERRHRQQVTALEP